MLPKYRRQKPEPSALPLTGQMMTTLVPVTHPWISNSIHCARMTQGVWQIDAKTQNTDILHMRSQLHTELKIDRTSERRANPNTANPNILGNTI